MAGPFFSPPVTFQDGGNPPLSALQLNSTVGAIYTDLNSLQAQINAGAVAGVQSINAITGAITFTSTGGTITITPGANSIDFEATASGTPSFFASTMVPGGPASTNTTSMQADITALLAKGGGTYLLPPGNCQINNRITVGALQGITPGVYAPIKIVGQSGKSSITQTVNSDVFQVNINPSQNGDLPGLELSSFYITYSAGLTSGAAIRITSGQHVRVDQMTFNDCPTCVACDTSLQTIITRCLAQYTNNTTTSGLAAFTFGIAGQTGGTGQAIEANMFANVIRTKNTIAGGPGGTALGIYNAENCRFSDLRLEGMTLGVIVAPGPNTGGTNIVQKLRMARIYVEAADLAAGKGNGFLFQPATNGTIIGVTMEDCWANTGNAITQTGVAGITFDVTNSGATIDQVDMTSVKANAFGGAGLRFNAATGSLLQNITLNGGRFYQNGVVTTSGIGSAGIYFHGATNGTMQAIRLNGVVCTNTATVIPSASSGTQAYGLTADGTINGFKATSCILTGNGTLPTNFALVTPGNFWLVSCDGYNDQNTQIFNGTYGSSATQFDATTIGATPYYGPFTASYTGGSGVTGFKYGRNRTLPGALQGLAADTVTCAVGQSMEIDYTTTAPSLTVTGQ